MGVLRKICINTTLTRVLYCAILSCTVLIPVRIHNTIFHQNQHLLILSRAIFLTLKEGVDLDLKIIPIISRVHSPFAQFPTGKFAYGNNKQPDSNFSLKQLIFLWDVSAKETTLSCYQSSPFSA